MVVNMLDRTRHPEPHASIRHGQWRAPRPGARGCGFPRSECQRGRSGLHGLRSLSVETGGEQGNYAHDVLAVVLRIRGRCRACCSGSGPANRTPAGGRCPGGRLGPDEDVEASVRRQLAEKVDLRRGRPRRAARGVLRPAPRTAARGESPPRSSASCPPTPTRPSPTTPRGTRWTRCRRRRSTTARSPGTASTGCAPSCPTRTSASRCAPDAFTISELRDLYVAALGHRVSATNLHRVLTRRGVLVPTGETAPPGPSGGRPAAMYRFSEHELRVTDPFAALRPPGDAV